MILKKEGHKAALSRARYPLPAPIGPPPRKAGFPLGSNQQRGMRSLSIFIDIPYFSRNGIVPWTKENSAPDRMP